MFKKLLITNAVFLSIVFSGQIEFESFNIEDGLAQNTVYEIFQDSRGYLWLGTQGGLDRFNGYEFINYEHEDGDSTSIPAGWIRCIVEDEEGIIWLGTMGGNFGWLDPYSETGHSIDLFENHPNINRPQRIDEIFFHDDNIFISTIGSGLCRYNRRDGSTLWYMEDSTAKHYYPVRVINSVFERSKNELVIGDNLGIHVLNTETNTMTSPYDVLFKEQLGFSMDSLAVTNIDIDDDGNWYIGTWRDRGLIVFNPEKETVEQHFPLQDPSNPAKTPRTAIADVTLDKNNKAWLSLFNVGVSIFDPIEKTFLSLSADPNNPSSITDSQIESIVKDRSGAMWLGGARSLMKHDPEKKKFNLISNSPTADIRSSFNDFWGIFIDSNEDLWAGSVFRGNGVDHINLKTKEVVNHVPKKASDARGVALWYLAEDAGGRIWGRTTYDLPISDANKSEFTGGWETANITFKETGSFNHYLLDKENRFWVFTEKKTWWVEFQGDSIVWTDVATKQENLKDIINLNHPIESKNNEFFVVQKSWDESLGTTNQLLKIRHGNYSVDTLYDHSTAEKKIPGFGSTTHIYETNDGGFWITTYGEGITRFDISTKEFTHYGIKQGLPNSYIYAIYEDLTGHLWMSSNYGIIKMNPKNMMFRQYGLADGIQNFEYNSQSHAQGEDGTLYFGGLSGLNYFNPNTMEDNQNKPTVIIENFTKGDSLFVLHKSDTTTETYNVHYYEKDLSFNFASIDYRDPSRNKHAYMMEGYDEYWTYSGTRRYASYTNLPPGDYTFRVKGSNNDGVWNEGGASLKIKILPAPWETVWAYMLYFATTGFGIFGYVKRQRRLQAHAMEEQHREEEMEEARQFQLDMLPKTTPDMLNLDIAATIQTASEVGGDYYDFFPEDNGESLYVVVGDATGHGMTAGMMVSITKAGLYGIPPSIAPNDITKQLNRVIKNIDLGWNRMAINVARFWEDRVEFTSAAMPPAYHYHKDTGEVDEILLEGLPLGSFQGETFSLVDFEFKQGDSLVFISDGLPEATNQTEHMLGYQAVQDCVKANGHHNANDQKQALLDLGSAWLGDLRNQDDITIVVVKKSKPLD